jgi:hypothetical protein
MIYLNTKFNIANCTCLPLMTVKQNSKYRQTWRSHVAVRHIVQILPQDLRVFRRYITIPNINIANVTPASEIHATSVFALYMVRD